MHLVTWYLRLSWPAAHTYYVQCLDTNESNPSSSLICCFLPPLTTDNTFGSLGPTITFQTSGQDPTDAAVRAGSYVPIPTSSTARDPSAIRKRRPSSGAAPTPPMVPQFLMGGGGNRGSCPIPLPMINPGRAVPPTPPATNSSAGANQTAAAGNAGNATRPGNTTAGARQGGETANSTSSSSQVSLLTGFSGNSSAGRVQDEAGKAVRSAGGQGGRCDVWSKTTESLILKQEDCPFNYPRITLEVSRAVT